MEAVPENLTFVQQLSSTCRRLHAEFIVRNSRPDTVDVERVQATPSSFRVTGEIPAEVAPGSALSLSMVFDPREPGEVEGTVAVFGRKGCTEAPCEQIHVVAALDAPRNPGPIEGALGFETFTPGCCFGLAVVPVVANVTSSQHASGTSEWQHSPTAGGPHGALK